MDSASGTISEPVAAGQAPTAPRPQGAALIQSLLPTLPNEPGVYRMLGARGEVLYVGKAKSLRKRVAAYTRPETLGARLGRMVALTRDMEFVTTGSEVEALLLEANLIKRWRPPFNIVLRDDKSFPYIVLDHNHPFPSIGKHRGAKKPGCEYFGPFASAGAVNETLKSLLKAFPLRNCSDTVFQNRTRPCLQYQIKRCSAPCVGYIDAEAYGRIVEEVRLFLSGRSRELQERLADEMHEAAEALEFERAAVLRDRLRALAHVQSRQGINTTRLGDADVVGIWCEGGQACVQVFFYRDGRNYGNRAFHPAHAADREPGEVLTAFLAQFYAERTPPPLVLTSDAPVDAALLAAALSQRAGRRVEIAQGRRGTRRQLVEIAVANARQALARRIADHARQGELLAGLAQRLGLPRVPRRIEIYDNSHIRGTHAVGAFVVATPEGFDRKAYRSYDIRSADLAPGDDYAMMREVLQRRFARLAREDPDRSQGQWPDLVILDGGAGQLAAARAVLGELGIADLPLLAVAKGPERDAGRERLFVPGREPFVLDPRDPVLYFLQRLRDEAHRYVLAAHRGKRSRSVGRSVLDRIPGVGAKRKRALLGHFGSARAVGEAGIADLEQVPGISRSVARAIYDHFHESG